MTAGLFVSLPHAASGSEFVFFDKTSNLAPDPIANIHDTLDVDLADVDGDGDLDAFFVDGSASAAPFPNRLLINDGTGVFADESAARLPPGPPANSTEVDFADVDGDGDLDAIVSNLGPNQLLINDGNGRFSDGGARLPQAAPPGPPGFVVNFPPFFIEISAEAIFADIDGDRDPDILISNENPLPFGPPGDLNRVLINDGTGRFTEELGRIPVAVDQTSGFVPGDVDGDGDLDLVQVNIGPNQIFMNNGFGFFVDETAARLPANSSSSRKASLADIDGDGDLDLFVANSRNQQNRLYVNDGSGFFTDETSRIPARLDTSTDVDFIDLNGDGYLDAYVTNVGDFVGGHGFLGDTNILLINDGTGRFEDSTFPRASERTGRSTNAAFGDVDGDGHPDLLVANSGGVDQPGLPPPDGVDRIYSFINCDQTPAVCAELILGGLDDDLGLLSTEPYPTGDMTSPSVRVNAARKLVLSRWIEEAKRNVASNLGVAKVRVRQVRRRLDGQRIPRDWVTGPAAARLFTQADFIVRASGRL